MPSQRIFLFALFVLLVALLLQGSQTSSSWGADALALRPRQDDPTAETTATTEDASVESMESDSEEKEEGEKKEEEGADGVNLETTTEEVSNAEEQQKEAQEKQEGEKATADAGVDVSAQKKEEAEEKKDEEKEVEVGCSDLISGVRLEAREPALTAPWFIFDITGSSVRDPRSG